jgi:hypothetical protein
MPARGSAATPPPLEVHGLGVGIEQVQPADRESVQTHRDRDDGLCTELNSTGLSDFTIALTRLRHPGE